MSLSNLVRLLVERDETGEVVINAKGKPNPTWMTPISIHFYKAEPTQSPEENLWREAVARLVLDAVGFASVGNKSKPERLKSMAEAQATFRNDKNGAALMFAAAGIEFEPVHEAIMQILDSRELSEDEEEKITRSPSRSAGLDHGVSQGKKVRRSGTG